jgi:short-subunit dehydrogenase
MMAAPNGAVTMIPAPDKREIALITGASSGIGTEFARDLAARGYDLVLTARREDRLLALQKELMAAGRTQVDVVPEDLGAPDGAASLIRRVEALGRPVSFLVNNAGFGVHGDFLDGGSERIAQMLQLNLVALTTLTWHFGRAMKTRGNGRVLQVSSVGAFQPTPYYAAYSATKAYVLFLSEAVNSELRGSGVTVTTLCPGLTETEFHEVAAHPKSGPITWTAMTAQQVARIGVRGALRGRAVVTPGLMNKIAGLSVKLLPRSWATAMAGLMMRN